MREDKRLQDLKTYVVSRWPYKMMTPEHLQPYGHLSHGLTLVNEWISIADHLVVPILLRE